MKRKFDSTHKTSILSPTEAEETCGQDWQDLPLDVLQFVIVPFLSGAIVFFSHSHFSLISAVWSAFTGKYCEEIYSVESPFGITIAADTEMMFVGDDTDNCIQSYHFSEDSSDHMDSTHTFSDHCVPEGFFQMASESNRVFVCDTNQQIITLNWDGNANEKLVKIGTTPLEEQIRGMTCLDSVFYCTSGMFIDVITSNGHRVNRFSTTRRRYSGLCIVEDELFVGEGMDGEILVFTLDGKYVESFGAGHLPTEGSDLFLAAEEDQMFVMSSAHCVKRFNLRTAKYMDEFGANELAEPQGIGCYNGRVYVADQYMSEEDNDDLGVVVVFE